MVRNTEYLYKKEYYKEQFECSYFSNQPLGCTEYDDATILPWCEIVKCDKAGGGVLTSKNEYLINTGLHGDANVAYDVEQVAISEEKVIYLGLFASMWGHHITDNIRRLWFLETETYKQKYSDYKIVYIAYPNFKFQGNYKQIIDIMGFDCTKFELVTEPTRFKQVVIPDESFYTYEGGARFFTKEYRTLIHRVREYGIKNKQELGFDKVYYTHARIASVDEIGEYKLENFFKEQGYEIIAPENLTFYEQLNILVQCKKFASTIGSASHNIMFMQDDTEAILIPRSNYLTGYQVAVDEVSNLNIHYIDSSMSILTDGDMPWLGPFYFYLGRELTEYFGKKIDLGVRRKDFIEFKRYLCLGKMLRIDLSSITAVGYYGEALMRFLEECRSTSVLSRIPRGRKCVRKITNMMITVLTKIKK